MTFDFEKERKAANANIRELKITQPFIFPQWQRVQNATESLRDAQYELERALKEWNDLGSDNVGEK